MGAPIGGDAQQSLDEVDVMDKTEETPSGMYISSDGLFQLILAAIRAGAQLALEGHCSSTSSDNAAMLTRAIELLNGWANV